MQNQFFTRLILALFFVAGYLVKGYAQPPCAMPPPEALTVTSITPTSISLAWLPPPLTPTYSITYKVSCFDETDMVALPDEYTTLLTHTRSGLQPGHFYRIGVSASQCNNDFGEEIVQRARTSTIIIDYIVQNSCTPGTFHSKQIGDTTVIILTPGVIENEPVQVLRHRVRKANNWAVDYTIWADCNGTPHYRALQETNVSRTPPPGDDEIKTLSIEFDDPLTTASYFRIGEVYSGLASGGQLVTKVVVTYETPCSSGICSSWLGNYQCPAPPVQEEGGGEGGSDFGRSDASNSSAIPAFLNLSAVPNPTSGAVAIAYSIPSEGSAMFTLFGVTGQTIKTFEAPGVLQPGLYNTILQLDEHPAGMYFLALQTGAERRMITIVKQ